MMKYGAYKRKWPLENIVCGVTIFAGIIFIILQRFGLLKDQSVVNSWIIGLLCLLATSELLYRIRKLEKIEDGIEILLKAKESEFTKDINAAWIEADKMIKNVKKGGYIYDTTSITNPPGYEDAVEIGYKEGVHITRLVCTNDFQADINKFIRIPKDYKSKKNQGKLSILHLPFALPFDMLITASGEEIQVIIGFRESETIESFYTSALRIYKRELANVVFLMFQNVLMKKAIGHQEYPPNKSTNQCKICTDIQQWKLP